MSDANPDYDAATVRAAYVAEVLGCDPPARLLDEHNCPSPEALEFVHQHGANLDFIFMGDLRAMILADCAARKARFAGKDGGG